MQGNRFSGYRAQSRSKAIAYTLTVGILLLLLAVLQVSFFGRFSFFGAVPDLMLCAVMVVSFFLGRYTGAISGIAAGFLIESIGSSGISLLPIFYMLCGYICGHYARAINPKRYPVYLIFFGVSLLLRAAMTLIYICLTYRNVNLPENLLYSVLPELGGTAIAGLILYAPIKPICAYLERKG